MRWDQLQQEQCSIARFLSVFGDRWSLLIMSDAFLGVRRFETFMSRLGISRTSLTQRLADLCDHGVLERVAYRERPERFEYRLTSKGLSLHPVIMSMNAWGDEHYADEAGPPIRFQHAACGHDFTPVLHCSECGEAVDPFSVRVRVRPDVPGFEPITRGPIREGRKS